jgi:hypothetical protein
VARTLPRPPRRVRGRSGSRRRSRHAVARSTASAFT